VIRVQHEGDWAGHGAVSARRNEVPEMLVVLQRTSNVEADMTWKDLSAKTLQMPGRKVQPGAWMRRLMFDIGPTSAPTCIRRSNPGIEKSGCHIFLRKAKGT
jgi:hypothetical protein